MLPCLLAKQHLPIKNFFGSFTRSRDSYSTSSSTFLIATTIDPGGSSASSYPSLILGRVTSIITQILFGAADRRRRPTFGGMPIVAIRKKNWFAFHFHVIAWSVKFFPKSICVFRNARRLFFPKCFGTLQIRVDNFTVFRRCCWWRCRHRLRQGLELFAPRDQQPWMPHGNQWVILD